MCVRATRHGTETLATHTGRPEPTVTREAKWVSGFEVLKVLQ